MVACADRMSGVGSKQSCFLEYLNAQDSDYEGGLLERSLKFYLGRHVQVNQLDAYHTIGFQGEVLMFL
jgi:hypothetical protein